MYKNGSIMPVDENTYYIYDGVSDKFIKRVKTAGDDYSITDTSSESLEKYWSKLLFLDLPCITNLKDTLMDFSKSLALSSTSSDTIDGYDVGLKLQKHITYYYLGELEKKIKEGVAQPTKLCNILLALINANMDLVVIPRKHHKCILLEVHCGTRGFDETIDEFITLTGLVGLKKHFKMGYLSLPEQNMYLIAFEDTLSMDIDSLRDECTKYYRNKMLRYFNYYTFFIK